MEVSGHLLYTASADGLAVYDIGSILGDTTATVSVQVPNGTGVSVVPDSFNEAPTRIVSGTDFDTLVWDGTLGPGNPDLTLTWDTAVSGLQPGESRDVTLGARLTSSARGRPDPISLPQTSVAADPILGLAPASRRPCGRPNPHPIR